MKNALKFALFLSATCAGAHAQVTPAAMAGAANLGYSLRYSHVAEFGGGIRDRQAGTASGSVRYSNDSTRLPFDLKYSGGYTRNLAGPSYSNGFFQRMLLSQGIVWRKWDLFLSDDVSYRPQAPTIGFSGIAGTGEPIGGSGPNPPSSESILTLNTRVVNNVAHGDVNHLLNYAMTLSFGGSSDLLRFPDGNGLDTNSQSANAGLTWRLNARKSFSSQYVFSRFTYPDSGFSIDTHSGLVGFKRVWNRAITTSASAGPEWIASSDSSTVPSSIMFAANASVNYAFRGGMADVTYRRGTTGGSGYLLGSESDAIFAGFSREFERKLTIELSGGYRRTAGLHKNEVIEGEFAGAQANRRLGKYLGVFANYTVTTQSSSAALPTNTLHHMLQVVSFGIGYTSREAHLSH